MGRMSLERLKQILVGIVLLVFTVCSVYLLQGGRYGGVVFQDLLMESIKDVEKAGTGINSRLVHKSSNSVITPTMVRRRFKNPKSKNPKSEKERIEPTLPPDFIRGIKTFVFFVGYPRSGHSIVGSILDAHPHIIMSHEFMLFMKLSSFFSENDTAKAKLFNMIYQRSVEDIHPGGQRNVKSTRKGYTLAIGSLWQGKFDNYVQVIGDKSGGTATLEYLRDRTTFIAHYRELVKNIGVPIKVLHVLRNPYDTISTNLLYMAEKKKKKVLKNRTAEDFVVQVKKRVGNTAINMSETDSMNKFNNYTMLEKKINSYFDMVQSVVELIELISSKNVLNIHHRDLVHDPRGTILSITSFLGVDVEDKYMQVCADKIYKVVSHSRNLVVWPNKLRMMVEYRMKQYEMLGTYSFTSD